MINHARTLLLNIAGSERHGVSFPGEEFVPRDYKVLTLPTALRNVRTILFGNEPDRVMMNYRLRQFMALLHSTELSEFVLDLDPRVTYLANRSSLFAASTFAPVVTEVVSAGSSLVFHGVNTIGGSVLQHAWSVEILASTIRVRRQTPPLDDVLQAYTTTDGLSSAISLTGSQLGFRVQNPTVGQKWKISAVLRPEIELGEIAVALSKVGEPTLLVLFGTERTEPVATFRELWLRGVGLPYKLGSVLAALTYRTNLIRGTIQEVPEVPELALQDPGPDGQSGLLLEEDTDGISFLLLEEGDYLMLEEVAP